MKELFEFITLVICVKIYLFTGFCFFNTSPMAYRWRQQTERMNEKIEFNENIKLTFSLEKSCKMKTFTLKMFQWNQDGMIMFQFEF